jgi:hypothetical protein
MNTFTCTFHDLRHTFNTMMIGNGCDVRAMASYLGHPSVSMTLDIYVDVNPEAKRAAVAKVDENFDDPESSVEAGTGGLAFTVGQLRAMPVEAKKREGDRTCGCLGRCYGR